MHRPLMVATALLVAGALHNGVAMNLLVRIAAGLFQGGLGRAVTLWKSIGVMAIVTLITAASHLIQVAFWAVAFMLCGQFSSFERAFYFSAQNYTSLGYGDVVLTTPWQLLGPLEAVNGLLCFGLSTAVLFAILSRLIADRVRSEIGYRSEGAENREPLSAIGDRFPAVEHAS